MTIQKTVTLIRPPNFLLYNERLQTPIGILTIASYLRERKIPVNICDLAGIPQKKWPDIIPWERDIFGVSATTGDFSMACRIAKLIKENKPEAILVLGGAHVTALPEKSLKEIGIF